MACSVAQVEANLHKTPRPPGPIPPCQTLAKERERGAVSADPGSNRLAGARARARRLSSCAERPAKNQHALPRLSAHEPARILAVSSVAPAPAARAARPATRR